MANLCKFLLQNFKNIEAARLAANLEKRSLSTLAVYCSKAPESHRPIVLRVPGCDAPFKRLLQHVANRSVTTNVLQPFVDPELSYAFGKSNNNLIYSTVAQELDKVVLADPDHVVYVSAFENKQVTWRELNRDVNKVTKALIKKFDVSKGDFVGVFSYNCYNWIVIEFACARIGAILTPVNPSYKSSELEYILKKGKVKCLFMPGPKSVQSELNNHMKVLQSDRIVSLTREKQLDLRNVVLMDSENSYNLDGSDRDIDFKLANCAIHNWSETENDGLIFKSIEEAKGAGVVDEKETCIVDPDSLSPDDVFAVYYTSGTTGSPKGACITNFTVINNVRSVQNCLRHGRPEDFLMRCATVLPMFHIYAGVLISLYPLLCRGQVIYSTYKYDIKAFVESIIKHNVNTTALTPTILIDMLTYIETNKLTNIPLRIVQSGGAALAPEIVSRAFKILPDIEELRLGYGSSENGALATFQSMYEPAETRSNTVGPPIEFTECRIVEPNSDKLVAHGQKGEIQTRGFNTMLEYLDLPEKTAEVITPARWYRTGDIGFMHKHGSIQICGRLKHMIIKGGENVYPEEVEQMIHKLDYVEDVHVVGVPDERFGEQICAWIKLKPGYREIEARETRSSERQVHKEDVLDFCKKNITYFKIPKYLLFVDEFPMTPTKKVQNHVITEKSIEIFGLQKHVSSFIQTNKQTDKV